MVSQYLRGRWIVAQDRYYSQIKLKLLFFRNREAVQESKFGSGGLIRQKQRETSRRDAQAVRYKS